MMERDFAAIAALDLIDAMHLPLVQNNNSTICITENLPKEPTIAYIFVRQVSCTKFLFWSLRSNTWEWK